MQDFVSGACGGVCMIMASHPFDLLKVRLQTSFYESSSILNAVKCTVKADGISGLYRGALPVVVGAAPTLGLSFWSFEMAKGLFGRKDLSIVEVGLAGSVSGIVTSVVLGPAERIKIMLQTSQKARSVMSLVSAQVRNNGVKSLMRGSGLTALRDSIANFWYFGTYEYIQRTVSRLNYNEKNPFMVLLAGGVAGIVNWSVIFPIDTVKSVYQSSDTKTLIQVIRQTKSFYKGLAPTLLRAFPASAGFFAGIEGSRYGIEILFSE